jgi:hypothetical protein
MSAFVVDHAHIHALLTFAQTKRLQDRLGYCVNHGSERLSWDTLGKVLLAENERSVCHRYPDCTEGNMPGTIGQEAINYRFKMFAPFSQRLQWPQVCVWVIKACDCYDYQACETDDYDTTPAHRMIKIIRAEAVRCLPGYDDAPWSISDRVTA